MNKMKKFRVLAMLLVLVMAITACGGGSGEDTPDTQDTPAVTDSGEDKETDDGEDATTEEDKAPEVDMSKTGAHLDSITIIGVDEAAAVTQLQAGAINAFAGTLPGNYAKEIENAGLKSAASTGTSYELMLNNADTTEKGETFNPFAIREIREALNWLIDRDYIAKEIFDGAAIPRQFAISSASPDYAKYIEYARVEEAKYSYNKDKAVAQIEAAMETAGVAKNADGKYEYNGEPVLLKFYIRTEDGLRQPAGDYISNQLEDIGFTVDRIYRVSAECSPVVFGTEPAEGQWHLYTGAWGASGLARDTGIYFHDYVSPESRYSYMPWKAFQISDEYNDVLTKLAYNDFTTMEEREELFAAAFAEHNYWATRIWLVDGLAYTPWNENVTTSYNLSAGVANDQMTAYTIKFNDKEGGDLVWGNSAPPFVNPINPISGSNWSYDSQYMNLTRDYIAIANPYTGLRYLKRLESASVTIQEGLPVAKTYDWVDLSFEKEIKVPEDVMIDWDPATETWMNANADYFAMKVTKAEEALAKAEEALAAASDEEKAAAESAVASAKEDLEEAKATADKGYLTAKAKITYTFPEDMSGFTWHDGKPVELADIMMNQIMGYATAYKESPYYDSYVAPSFLAGLEYVKGWKIVSENPIVIEKYSDNFVLDAENNVSPLNMGWTYDSNGAQASWSALAIGNRVVESGTATYSEGASDANDALEWMNYIDGPSLEYLAKATDELIAESYIPFEATMGKYITAEDAKTAYENTKKFYDTNKHFVIGCEPYYISNVLSTEGSVTLTKYEGYDEPTNKWAFLEQPKLADIVLDGPASVSAGTTASFDVYITDPNGDDYPVSDITAVKYLLYASNGEIVAVEDATSDTDGLYTIELSDADIEKLGTGACKLEVVVSPKAVASPSILQSEFIVE